MTKEKIQVTIEPRGLAGFIATVIRKYKFNNKNLEPDEIIIPNEVSDYIPVKIVWPKDTADEEIIYGLEKRVKELEGVASQREAAIDELIEELDTAKKSIAELTNE